MDRRTLVHLEDLSKGRAARNNVRGLQNMHGLDDLREAGFSFEQKSDINVIKQFALPALTVFYLAFYRHEAIPNLDI